MHMANKLGMAGVALCAVVWPAHAATLNSMNEVGAALQACWSPPDSIKKAKVTLSFSFKRDGTLIGPPRPTAIEVDGDAKTRKAFVDAAVKALQQCVPLSFSPKLAQGISGTVYTQQFTSKD